MLIAQTKPFARVLQQVGRVAHRFHPARNDDRAVAGLDRLRGKSDRFQSGAANFVDCHGTCFRSESSEDCSLARGILAESGRDNIAHDALVNQLGIDVRALHSFAHGDRAKLRGSQITETSLKFSDWRAAACNDHNIA